MNQENLQEALVAAITPRLTSLYVDRAPTVINEMVELLTGWQSRLRSDSVTERWSERDIYLICYPDQIEQDGENPLKTLKQFVADIALSRVINGIHILPFFPYSSDDGFAVSDYTIVDPENGSWEDVQSLSSSYKLMFDFVLNHTSAEHPWFKAFLREEPEFRDFYITRDPSEDLSAVTRPRSTPLLHPFETPSGTKYVWANFSADQPDLNYANPQVLIEMTKVLLEYIARGATLIRLDAVNYLWKEKGTNCNHLRQTHTVIKLFRSIIELIAPHVVIVTETNVPHNENISYFGDGDEAHMVYNFSLPPLAVEAMLSGNTDALQQWARSVCTTPPGTTFFNFIASHDGIGLRPLTGLLPQNRIDNLVESALARKGLATYRLNPDGTKSPYELNITLFDMLSDPSGNLSDEHWILRLTTIQSICLAMRGVPALYFQSLFAKHNDLLGVTRLGYNRAINRRKFDLEQLKTLLGDRNLFHGIVFERMKGFLQTRRSYKAFHPESPQQVLELENSRCFGILRGSNNEAVYCLSNFSAEPQTVKIEGHAEKDVTMWDILRECEVYGLNGTLVLRPYETLWLQNSLPYL